MNRYLPISRPDVDDLELKYIEDCVKSGWVSSAGEYVTRFEKLNSEYYGTEFGVAVSNGTVALHLALVALGIGPGDEVIIPDLTFAATANAILYTGATPVLADVEYGSWTIDVESAEQLVNEKTKAIIPVHLYGQPCDMTAVSAFAKKYGLYIVEDCAEAHGAEFNGKKIGSFGDISCFSFYGNKIITCGEGGICLTDDETLVDKMKILRDHGMSKSKRYWHDSIGFNYRMTNMQAALGCAQMERIDEILNNRARIEKGYNDRLSAIPCVKIQNSIPDREKVCWLYSIIIDINESGKSIEEIQYKMKVLNIDSRPFFYPMHQMPPYKNLKHNSLDNSLKISRTGLSLPTYNSISASEINYICDSLMSILTS